MLDSQPSAGRLVGVLIHLGIGIQFYVASLLRMAGVGVIVGDSLVRFFISERVNNDWLLSHFAAANPEFTDVSGYLLHYIAQSNYRLGFRHYNSQEDVGDPGLRRFKMKCAPNGFLRKFSVSLERAL